MRAHKWEEYTIRLCDWFQPFDTCSTFRITHQILSFLCVLFTGHFLVSEIDLTTSLFVTNISRAFIICITSTRKSIPQTIAAIFQIRLFIGFFFQFSTFNRNKVCVTLALLFTYIDIELELLREFMIYLLNWCVLLWQTQMCGERWNFMQFWNLIESKSPWASV